MGTRRDFNGKAVLITGGGGGLGRALARAFGRAGARLALLDIDQKALQQAVAELAALGLKALPLPCDITDQQQAQEAVAEAARRLGGPDVMINNAGITHRSAFVDTEPAVLAKVMAVNYLGAVNCSKAALPGLLASSGLIIAISSIAGFSPLLGRTGYAAAKHALHGLFNSLRAELAPRGVDVLLVCPGFTDTGIAHRALGGDGSLTSHPQSKVGRAASPDQVAGKVLRAAQKGRRQLVLSAVGRLTLLMSRFAPALYERLMTRSLRSELER